VPLSLRFEPVDLHRDSDTCIRFRRDSYFCSFGDGEAFDPATGGTTGYLDRLRQRLAALPEGIVHAWRGDRIVGQIEAQVPADRPGGYVNLFYLVADERGRGAGDELHAYLVSLFRRIGLPAARLSVSPSNARAVRYYSKHGWCDLGPRPGHEIVHLMELTLSRVTLCQQLASVRRADVPFAAQGRPPLL
jgi:GNAT superfamily N-acetyltransferase